MNRIPIPKEVRRAVMCRAEGRCEDCGRESPLELHHLTYTRWLHHDCPVDIFGREEPEDLKALCRSCHHGRHIDPAGDFWRDPEDLQNNWEPYYLALEKD